MPEPTLKLTDLEPTREDAPFVDIGGDNYYFLDRTELTMRIKAKIQSTATRIQRLSEEENPTEADEREYAKLVIEFAKTVLVDASEAIDAFVNKPITDADGNVDELRTARSKSRKVAALAQVATIFFMQYADVFVMDNMTAAVRSKKLTGELLSQGFRDSMGATRNGGNT